MLIIKVLSIALILLCVYKIYNSKNYLHCFMWFMLGMYLIHPNAELFRMSYAGSRLVLIFAFIARLLKDHTFSSVINRFPLKIELLLMFVFLLIQPLFTGWSGIKGVNWAIQDFLSTYFLFILGFVSLPSNVNIWKNIKKYIYIILLVVVLVGYMSYFMTENFVTLAHSASGEILWSSERALSERGFRSTGTQFSPNIFGLINVTLILLLFHFEKNNYVKLIGAGLLLMNIFFCGTRAPFVVLLLSLIVYGFLINKKQMLKSLCLGLPFLVVFIYFLRDIPIVQSYVEGVLDILLTGGENTGGSSVELRNYQMATALMYFAEAPWVGHGIYYTMNLINENGLFYNRYNSLLAGAEGYPFYLLIDYGVIYITLVISFMARVALYFYRNLNIHRSIAIALLFAEILFVMTSQPAHSWEVLFPWLGLFMRYVYNSNLEKKTHGYCISL